MNWKKTVVKSLIIIMWLWVPLLFWEFIGRFIIGFIVPSNLDWFQIYQYSFYIVHILSIIGLSDYIDEEKFKGRAQRMS